MDKKKVLESVRLAREFSKKRNFSQTFDIIINLKDLNVKKADENVDIFVVLPNSKGKQTRICALVDKDLVEKAKIFDMVIPKSDFLKYKNPKMVKQIAGKHDFFIAQATIMTDIAKTFGKILGVRGKMPNPKAGCVITPSSDPNQLKQRLQKTVRLKTKNEPIMKVPIGTESMPDQEIVEYFVFLYNNLTHSLPKEDENIGPIFMKLTMGPSVRIGENKQEFEARIKSRKKKEKPTEMKEKPGKKEAGPEQAPIQQKEIKQKKRTKKAEEPNEKNE